MITMMSGLPAAKPGAAEKAIEALFKAAVDHYLVACTKPGDKPNKPDSGKLTLRIPPVSTPMSPRQTRSAVKASINGLLMF
jgi:predicted HicB family RNase H-like nuclease